MIQTTTFMRKGKENMIELEKKILSYNLPLESIRQLEALCLQEQITLLTVSEEEYDIPLGFLAYGSPDQKKDFLRSEDAAGSQIEEPMLIFAGFMQSDLMHFLAQMKSAGISRIDLKAMLTEHNAVWNSPMLYDEIKKEHEYMSRR